MPGLTNREKEELNKGILDYLKSGGYIASAEAFQKETEIEELDPKKSGLLEKKWTSVIRLQKKVMELEKQLEQVKTDAGTGGGGNPKARSRGGENLPRPPEQFTLAQHRENITALRFHPLYSLLVSGSQDATIKVWDFETGEFERTLKGHTNGVQSLDFDHGGKLLVSSSADTTIRLWDFQTYECIKTMHGHDHSVSCVRFLPSGDQIASASRDKSIRFWETSTGYCTKIWNGHEDWIRSIDITEDGSMVVSGSHDKTVRLWDVRKGECVQIMKEHSHHVECVAFSPATLASIDSPDGKTYKGKGMGSFIASGSRDKTIKIWETATGQSIMTLTGHDNWVRDLQFHPSGKFLISTSDDKSIRIWDLTQGRAVKSINDAHEHFVACMDFNVNNPTLATGGVDNVIKIWNCK